MRRKSNNKNYKPTINNRKAEYEYFILDKWIAGICLTGCEVKSIRDGNVQIVDSFCLFYNNEMWIKNMYIKEFDNANNIERHDSKRDRKLLLTKKELKKLKSALDEKGLTLIPLRIFFNDKNLAKIEIGLAKGKKLYDKRESIKQKDIQRDLNKEKE